MKYLIFVVNLMFCACQTIYDRTQAGLDVFPTDIPSNTIQIIMPKNPITYIPPNDLIDLPQLVDLDMN